MMISQIEDGIIAHIKAAQDNGSLGYTLKKLGSYGGEFAEGLKKAVIGFPAVLVIFGGATLVEQSGSRMKYSARWMIMVAAKNLRNEAKARKGSGDKVGSYQMAEDIINLIGNKRLGLDISYIRIEAIRSLANDLAGQDLASVYGIELSTTFEMDNSANPDDLDDFAILHNNWDLPPHGNVIPPLPSDETADATDHIEMETA